MRTSAQYQSYNYDDDEADSVAPGVLNATGASADERILFGGDVLCEGKAVGDGTINALDLAVLMYAQASCPPPACIPPPRPRPRLHK